MAATNSVLAPGDDVEQRVLGDHAPSKPVPQLGIGGGVDGRPGQRHRAVAHRGVGRRGDAGGGELALVVDGAVASRSR